LTRPIFAALAGMAWAVVHPLAAHAQASRTCEFALAAWVATRLELQEAREARRLCGDARFHACTSEEGRVRNLEQRLVLVRQYIEGYCRR
jgi:hypothetical protein